MELTDIMRAFESGDFARSNLFEVEIPYLGKNFKFKCKAATLPSATVEKVPVGYMNRKINVAGDRTYDDWTITVYNDDAHKTRQEIVDWQKKAAGMGNTISGESPAEYKKTGIIRAFHRDGVTVTKEYTVVGIFPTLVAEVAQDWDTNNEVQTFEATFALDWWE